MKESAIEHYAEHVCKQRGGINRKCVWQGRTGAPDRLFILKGQMFFVEFKAPGEKLRPDQEAEIAKLRLAGATVFVIDSIEGVNDVFAKYPV